MSHIQEKLQRLHVEFLLDKKISITRDFDLINFQNITDILTYLKEVYLVFFQEIGMMLFYEFIQYVLLEFYGHEFVEYKYVNNQKSQIPDCLKFESDQFDLYLIIRQKSDGKLSIRPEFSLKLNTFHQGKERRYVVSRLISKGSYGKVYLCVDEHGNQFAMKLFQSKDEMDVELKALHHLKGMDEVIEVIDTFNFNIIGFEFGAFVMPFMKYTLKSFVEIKKPSVDFLLCVFYQLLCYLRKIHKMGCYHMDIKPENILMELLFDGTVVMKYKPKTVYMKLADFGISDILPKGTHYATTKDPKITHWFRCPKNALAEANQTSFHISWIGDFFALCVSIIYMCSHKSGKIFNFLDSRIFDIFRGQQFFKSNRSDDESPKELDVEFSKIRIEIACRNAIKNPFFRNLLMEYMNPESILRWYSELQTSPKDNSRIPEIIDKMETYFKLKAVISQLKEHFKKSESDIETPPRPHVKSP
jgi:serine/threonine protein kinase